MSEEERIERDFEEFRRDKPLPREAYFDGEHFGTVVEEVYVPEWAGEEYGDYVKLVQLIEKDSVKGEAPMCIRFGYYRRKGREAGFVWGSQTTLTIEKSDWLKLKEKAEKAGFW